MTDPTPETDQTEAAEEQTILSAGERLREAREAQGLSLSEAAGRTRQSQHLLEAVEAMSSDSYPMSVLRLHARTYAKALGLPEMEIARGFAESQADPLRAPTSKAGTDLTSQFSLSAPVLAIGAGLVVGTLVLGIGVMLAPGPKSAGIEAPVSTKVTQPPGNLADLSEFHNGISGPELKLIASRRAWVEVRASDGTVFRNREMTEGEAYFPRTGAGWTVTVQDAGAFKWQIGNQILGTLGDDGEAVYGVSVDTAMQDGLEEVSRSLAEAAAGPRAPR